MNKCVCLRHCASQRADCRYLFFPSTCEYWGLNSDHQPALVKSTLLVESSRWPIVRTLFFIQKTKAKYSSFVTVLAYLTCCSSAFSEEHIVSALVFPFCPHQAGPLLFASFSLWLCFHYMCSKAFYRLLC